MNAAINFWILFIAVIFLRGRKFYPIQWRLDPVAISRFNTFAHAYVYQSRFERRMEILRRNCILSSLLCCVACGHIPGIQIDLHSSTRIISAILRSDQNLKRSMSIFPSWKNHYYYYYGHGTRVDVLIRQSPPQVSCTA